MCVLGIICIRTYFVLALYNGNVLPPGTFDACGPAGGNFFDFLFCDSLIFYFFLGVSIKTFFFFLSFLGAGGIVMLMIGAIIVGISIWQLYKLKDIRRRFLGYTQKV